MSRKTRIVSEMCQASECPSITYGHAACRSSFHITRPRDTPPAIMSSKHRRIGRTEFLSVTVHNRFSVDDVSGYARVTSTSPSALSQNPPSNPGVPRAVCIQRFADVTRSIGAGIVSDRLMSSDH